MGEAVVPQAAVEVGLRAAKDAAMGAPTMSADKIVEHAVVGAAPHIAAAALRQAAEEHQPEGRVMGRPCSACGAIAWPCRAAVRLRQIAASLVPGRVDTREGILAAAGLTEADMQERADG